MVDAARASSFGSQADRYDALRPPYPAAAVAVALAGVPAGGAVADVGAGTGKLTRALVDAGYAVTAVEPDDAMRAVLADRLPGVPALAGRGEALPLPDGSVDAVTYGQAWHWVEAAAAGAEAARVLRPGGVLTALWNREDAESAPWLLAVDAVNPTPATGARPDTPPLPGFADPEEQEVAWTMPRRVADLPALVSTYSATAVLPEAERARVLERVAEIGRTHPDLAGREVVDVPVKTLVVRWVRA